MTKPSLTILLASPRGFCAGVDRAIEIVERALIKHGAPVYVRHEIVHNRFVVENLEQKGAIFVQELDEVPEGLPVIFSAHGVPKSVPAAAQARELLYFDATCPLVSKVHREAERHEKDGRQVILIGHEGHPEVIGTMGQIDEGSIVLVETEQDAEQLEVSDPDNLAYVTQTTLSVDDTASIVKVLMRRFPNMSEPKKEDICYATTNRQEAVKAIAKRCEALLVIGAPNSSNSKRLVEVAFKQGCDKSALVQRAVDIKWEQLVGVKTLGITAGASAPEVLVEEVIEACKDHFDVTIEEINIRDENVVFRVPKALLDTTTNKEIH
ncbi:4-hydroxy-3-methylbut-2-enyl diphosphate reductase [Kiloniella antarctica]|uniref:4-hydroxy-3-methylbut-2-enyl diphosphate reductase n=1 Tax=Kiloniella antarctica TaxID=1550907 RepID=A0ABW5BGN9_9PROT